ncbi:MAG: hypothetical protein IJ660_06770 [Alphaproteobacteria bacterium]|nr:hypothetical protein [Alphaproteobacteria bacterium]
MELNITDEKIMEQLGYPFCYWANYGQFKITDQDLKYLDIIKKHPCFSIILEGYQTLYPVIDWANARINEIVFYEHFYNDSTCPKGVKDILFAMIGSERGTLEEHNLLNLLNFRYFYVKKWIESVTKKSSR